MLLSGGGLASGQDVGDEVAVGGGGVEREATIEDVVGGYDWMREGSGGLGAVAAIDIPRGFRFVGRGDTQKLMTVFGNPLTGREEGVIAPESLDWFVVFEFNESGYVKDDEKDELDADEMFAEMKGNEKYANEARSKAGYSQLYLTGWVQEPRYNDETNNLEWALGLRSENGGENVNYETKLLGRSGVMDVTLVCNPDVLDAVLPIYQDLLLGYRYSEGNTYAEFEDGDKLAEYGLTGLIVGGGAVVAGKLGLFAVLGKFFAKAWKLVIVGVVGIGAFLKKLLGGGKSGYTQD